MTKIKHKNIVKLAEKLKTYVEENGKLPKSLTVDKVEYTYPQIGHILARSVCNIGKDVTVIKVKEAPDPTGETVTLKLTKEEYLKEAKNYYKFIEDETKKRLPNYSTIKNKKVKQRVMIYSLSKIIVWYNNKKRLPDSCKFYTSETVKKTTITAKKTSTSKTTTSSTSKSNCTNPYTSKPHYTNQGVGKLGQITNHHCGPCAVHQGLRKIGITKYSQETIGKYAGTTSSGTDPSGLETAILKIAKLEGIKLEVKRYYLSDFGKTLKEQMTAIGKLICKSNVFGFGHIGYEDSGEKRGSQSFGHYEGFDIIDINKGKMRILNSLGSKCSSSGYCGHLQWRSFELEKDYINNKSGVKSIWIVTKK